MKKWRNLIEKEKETTKVDKTEEVKVDKPKEEVKVETPKEEVKEPVKEEEKVEAPKVEEPKVKASIEIPEKSSEETQEAHVELATEIADDTITVTAGDTHTVVGNMIVQSAHSTTGALYGNSAQFRTRKTAANTFVTYRIA